MRDASKNPGGISILGIYLPKTRAALNRYSKPCFAPKVLTPCPSFGHLPLHRRSGEIQTDFVLKPSPSERI